GAERAEEIDAADGRQADVDEEHVGPRVAVAQPAERFLPTGEADDAVARLAQAKHQIRGDLLVVLDAGDEGHAATSLVPDIADADVQEAEAVSIYDAELRFGAAARARFPPAYPVEVIAEARFD